MRPGDLEAEAERLLIEESRSGSSNALAGLVQMHSPRIYRWSLRILKNHADAEDNMQNVLCKMYIKIDTFKGQSRFSTWLFRMTINEALTEIRRSRPISDESGLSQPVCNDNCAPNIQDRRADPEQQYAAKELLANAILGLHPPSAQLFFRHKSDGWTQRELADEMGISVTSVKARIFSAREFMRTRIRQLG